MLKLLAFIFPSVRKLVELKDTQKKLIDNLQLNVEYVHLTPIDRTSEQFIISMGSLWKESDSFKYLIYSIKQEIVKELTYGNTDAEAGKQQLVCIEKIISIFRGYEKGYEQLQIRQSEKTT